MDFASHSVTFPARWADICNFGKSKLMALILVLIDYVMLIGRHSFWQGLAVCSDEYLPLFTKSTGYLVWVKQKKTLFATLHKGHRIDWFTANLKVIITQKVHYILYVPSAPSIIKHPLGKLHLLIFHVHILIELALKFTATFITTAFLGQGLKFIIASFIQVRGL